jgi:hypothetical protein
VTIYQFMLRIADPPTDEQTRRLFDRTQDVCVEVGAFRRWAAVAVDRRGRTGPLSGVMVGAIRDLDAAGLVTIDTGPDCDLAPVSLIAARVGRAPRTVHRWLTAGRRARSAPAPVVLPGRPRYYRWVPVAAWLARTRPDRAPASNAATYAAVNLALRLRAIGPAVRGMAAVRSLVEVELAVLGAEHEGVPLGLGEHQDRAGGVGGVPDADQVTDEGDLHPV